jgi:adenylate cyclase
MRMTLWPRKKLRLRSSIVALFALLTVPIFLGLDALTYFSNEATAQANADELIGRFREEAIDNIQGMVDPIKSLVRSAATVGGQQPNLYKDNKSLDYLFSILEHSDRLISVYVGMSDGSFRQARRIDPKVKVHNKMPPAGAVYAYRWIESPNGGAAIDHYIFLDKDRKPLGTSDQATTYDPRSRLWYYETAEAGRLVVTDPEIFAALDLVGFTIAHPIYVDGKVSGVAAADLTLDGLSQFLSERKISAGTMSYIMNGQDGVLANSARAKTYSNEGGEVALQPLTALPNQLPAIAYSARPQDDQRRYSFSYAGQDYVASATILPLTFGRHWHLFTITPLADFTGAFQHNNKVLFIWGILALGAEILVIYFLSGVVAAPLERLATKVAKIENLSGEELPSARSSIEEISVLSKAIDTLGSTVQSFAAFVPVGLVRQLISSDRKLELGGHSQFLTIFFSDLESFSTLSEEIPTQELLVRVSAYLEVVTRAVDRESGTIDKFIGDGVMAFWGAPGLLEDHAWHACVAALRIQQDMAELNRRWAEQELKPLRVRIGIHSDAVLVGNIGSHQRMGYTVLGDGVNVAARLEGVNKEYGTLLCVSHSVFQEAGERLCVRPIDDVTVKGRRGKIPIYELMGAFGVGPELEPDEATLKLARLTHRAHEPLIHGDVALALSRYREILEEFPHDTVAQALIDTLSGTGQRHVMSDQAAA